MRITKRSLQAPRLMTHILKDRFLFKTKPRVPRGYLKELLVKEAHGDALGGHLSINKIIEIPR